MLDCFHGHAQVPLLSPEHEHGGHVRAEPVSPNAWWLSFSLPDHTEHLSMESTVSQFMPIRCHHADSIERKTSNMGGLTALRWQELLLWSVEY